jgi:hypothetical protein
MDKTAVIYKVHGHKDILVDKLVPHPAAIIPIEDCDRLSIQSSIAENQETVYLDIIVSHLPDPKTGKYFIYDGVNRWKAAIELKKQDVPCKLVETSNVKKLISDLMIAGRKKTTGSKVMVYLKAHEKEVLSAREVHGDGRNNLQKGQCFSGASHEAPETKAFSAEAISERIGCSREDVRYGIELLDCLANRQTPPNIDGCQFKPEPANDREYELLQEQRDRILSGQSPIRMWRRAFNGARSTKKTANANINRSEIDHMDVMKRGLVSVANGFKYWPKYSSDQHAVLLAIWDDVMETMPKDILIRMKGFICKKEREQK